MPTVSPRNVLGTRRGLVAALVASLVCTIILLNSRTSVALDALEARSVVVAAAHPQVVMEQTHLVSPEQLRRYPAIPKKMWYKLGPKGMSGEARTWIDSCMKQNKGYRFEFMTDDSADAYVEEAFSATHPQLVDLYQSLSVPIFKADILRYLLLYVEGGIYFDLDVSCEVPISQWIPADYKQNTSLVVGWEFDHGYDDNLFHQLEIWTMMAKPGSPHLWRVVEDIMHGFYEKMAAENVTASELTMDMMGDVVDVTGPRRFTVSLLRSIEERYGVRVDEIKNLVNPKLAGDVLVMPGHAFALSTNNFEGLEIPPPLVVHHYAGSWKNPHGGETRD